MKKALQVASVASMIDQFNMPNIEILHSMEYKVDVAANFDFGSTSSGERIIEFKQTLKKLNIGIHNILFDRKVLSINNIKAYKQLKKNIRENKYEIIHCHSPIGGALTRLAVRGLKGNGPKVIYTAHGFHFYKGASIKNWLLYYPIEKWLSKYTDILITINNEDYERAKNKFFAKEITYIPGIGIDIKKIDSVPVKREQKRKELGIPEEAAIVLSVGELNKNKNHEVIIRALFELKNPYTHYIISGAGELENKLRLLAKELMLEKQIHFLGFRSDVLEIYKIADLFIFPSYREGLSVALMEAMACKLPVICSNIRGNIDLIEEGKGGHLIQPDDINGYRKAIETLLLDKELQSKYAQYNQKKVREYSFENVTLRMQHIYIK